MESGDHIIGMKCVVLLRECGVFGHFLQSHQDLVGVLQGTSRRCRLQDICHGHSLLHGTSHRGELHKSTASGCLRCLDGMDCRLQSGDRLCEVHLLPVILKTLIVSFGMQLLQLRLQLLNGSCCIGDLGVCCLARHHLLIQFGFVSALQSLACCHLAAFLRHRVLAKASKLVVGLSFLVALRLHLTTQALEHALCFLQRRLPSGNGLRQRPWEAGA
mmetsp:Transcript_31408/g.73320  ORF Transcript_31408/g.73320 Transcript_31408/m.73320 type:complete len:216 (+) Transcript_31408:1560-2207(+)